MKEEYTEILKELGFSRKRSERLALDLKAALKKRGLEIKEEEKPKKKERIKKKDIIEIDNTYLKENDKEILE